MMPCRPSIRACAMLPTMSSSVHPPVERQRVVERLDAGGLGLGEARGVEGGPVERLRHQPSAAFSSPSSASRTVWPAARRIIRSVAPAPSRSCELRLVDHRHAGHLDEPDRRRVVEQVALAVGRQRLVVERVLGLPPDDVRTCP